MKIALTGHTRGIGKHLYEIFVKDHEITGFSTSNGFDISKEEIQDQIVDLCKNFDVFINNAWHPTGQKNLLLKFLKIWDNDSTKIIINIGSKVSFFPQLRHNYVESKIEIQKIIEERFLKPYPQIINCIPGVVDTDMGQWSESENKLSAYDAAKFIETVMYLNKNIKIQQIVFCHPKEKFEIKHDILQNSN